MVVSQIQASKRSPHSSSQKLVQRKVLEIKKKLLKKKNKETDFKHEAKKMKTENKIRDLIRYDGVVNSGKVGLPTQSRAEKIQENLPFKLPSFVKPMLKSHVTGGFWLGLPKPFCDKHLPKHDETVVLVNENGEEYRTKYLVEKNGLSAGWRGFSIAHKLLEGDTLVFQLIGRCKFKVYIVRANGLSEIDGAIALLNLDTQINPIETCQMVERAAIDLDPSPVKIDQEKNTIISISESEHEADRSGNESDEFCSIIMDSIRLSESCLDFKDVKSFSDFNIHVNGLIIDSEISQHLRKRYYDLCVSQKMYLHEHLVEGLNSKLAAGVISETINIADAVRAAKVTTSLHHLESWDKTLKAFGDLGMEVGFLRARLLKLVNISSESRARIESKRVERAKAENEIRDLEAKLSEVKGLIKNLDDEIKALKKNDEKLAGEFVELAAAPW